MANKVERDWVDAIAGTEENSKPAPHHWSTSGGIYHADSSSYAIHGSGGGRSYSNNRYPKRRSGGGDCDVLIAGAVALSIFGDD